MNKHRWGFHKVAQAELATLAAICKEVSGVAHRYQVERVDEHRARITYSNPDEYAVDHPISVILPMYFDGDSYWVIFSPVDFEDVDDEEVYDPYQLFTPVWWYEESVDPNTNLEPDVIRELYEVAHG